MNLDIKWRVGSALVVADRIVSGLFGEKRDLAEREGASAFISRALLGMCGFDSSGNPIPGKHANHFEGAEIYTNELN